MTSNELELPVALRRLAGHVRAVAEWPRSGTGHYRLRLHRADQPMLDETFSVRPRKISEASYQDLLSDLESSLPVSIAVGLERLGAMAGITLLPPGKTTLAQELVRLRRAVEGAAGRPGLPATLTEMARDPHRVLVNQEIWTSRDRARRVHPTRLVHAVAKGANLDVEGRPVLLPELRVEPTADVYENRLIKAFVDQVDLRLRRIARALQETGHVDLHEQAKDLLRRLTTARLTASFLDEVSPLTFSPQHLTMVLIKRPDYRRAFEAYLEFHRSAAVRLEEPYLESPLKNLPSLYETWGVLRVIETVSSLAEEAGFLIRRQQLLGRDFAGAFVRVLRNGRPALVLHRPGDDTTVRVIPQRSYEPGGEGLHSISYRQKPDVVLEVVKPGGEIDVYLLDPKYKLDSEADSAATQNARPKKIDIDTMHAYRDSIRDDAGTRVVRFAATLYPGPTVGFGPGLEAISAVPGQDEELNASLRSAILPALAGSAG